MATTHFLGPLAIGSGSIETLTAAKTLTGEDSGKTLFLGLAGGFTVTLPTPAAGLRFKFVVSVAPTTAYVIATNGGANILIGGFSSSELTDLAVAAYDDNADVINFVANSADVGDWCELVSDGTSWYFSGHVNLQASATTATT